MIYMLIYIYLDTTMVGNEEMNINEENESYTYVDKLIDR